MELQAMDAEMDSSPKSSSPEEPCEQGEEGQQVGKKRHEHQGCSWLKEGAVEGSREHAHEERGRGSGVPTGLEGASVRGLGTGLLLSDPKILKILRCSRRR